MNSHKENKMANEENSSGMLRVKLEADRVAIASILYKNGYSVKPVRQRRNGSSYDYFVKYDLENPDATGGL
jgi:hypothetical protein